MSVTFQSQEQEQCYRLVEDYLIVLELEYVKHDDVPVFSLLFEHGVHMRIGVMEWGDDDALVICDAPLIREARLSAALMRYMLEANRTMPLGHFALDDDGDIVICHHCGGNELDRAELADAVAIVASQAAQQGETIVERFGGERI